MIFVIKEKDCTGCAACSIACPTEAISGSWRMPHLIDQEACIQCSKCFNACNYNAIDKDSEEP